MNPITKEQLEQADDFVFHYTEQQLKEWLEDYRKRQYNVGTHIIREMNAWKKNEQKDFYLMISAVIISCFENYEGGISLITKDEIERSVKSWRRRFDKYDERISGFDCMVLFAEEESQPKLPFYIADKFLHSEYYQEVFDMDERAGLISSVLCLSFVINDKVKKFLPKQKIYFDDRGHPSIGKAMNDEKNALYKDVEEIQKRILATNAPMIKLQEDINSILDPYDAYFVGVSKHSTKLINHLRLWSKLEAKMPLGMDDKQHAVLKEITMLSGKIDEDASKAIHDLLETKESVFSYDKILKDCMDFITKTIPDTKKCIDEVERVENIYKADMKKYDKLHKDLPVLTSELEKASKLLNGIMN